MSRESSPDLKPDALLYYDGECPFCNQFADYLRLKECLNLTLVDARIDQGFKELCPDLEISEGLILHLEGHCLQGVDALKKVQTLCRLQGLFGSLYRASLFFPPIADGLYEVLKRARTATLKRMGKDPRI